LDEEGGVTKKKKKKKKNRDEKDRSKQWKLKIRSRSYGASVVEMKKPGTASAKQRGPSIGEGKGPNKKRRHSNTKGSDFNQQTPSNAETTGKVRAIGHYCERKRPLF